MINRMYRNYGKRCFDLLMAVPALVVLSPLIAVVALVVRFRLGSPVIFRQARAGLHGRTFTIFKFRSMTDAKDEHGFPLPDSVRLTSLGRFLRASSLDELPQLWNVIRGDMSLIGPRPQLAEYLEHYTPEQARRHEVHPGLTGWAQVNGRNTISWEQKFHYDVWYVDHLNGWLDLRILAMTVRRLLARHDVSAEGHATMPRYKGPIELAYSQNGVHHHLETAPAARRSTATSLTLPLAKRGAPGKSRAEAG